MFSVTVLETVKLSCKGKHDKTNNFKLELQLIIIVIIA